MLPLGPIQIFNFSNTVYYTKPSIFTPKTKFFRLDLATELCHPTSPKRQQTAEGISISQSQIFSYYLINRHKKCRTNRFLHQKVRHSTDWWEGTDSNHRSRRRRIYSPLHLTTLQPSHIVFNLIFVKKIKFI